MLGAWLGAVLIEGDSEGWMDGRRLLLGANDREGVSVGEMLGRLVGCFVTGTVTL